MDLFEHAKKTNAPLSERMRAHSLDEFVGQNHLIKEGSLLQRAIIADRLGSCIFYGPPGTGKTTLANIIAKSSNAECVYLNAVSSGVADAKKVIADAVNNLALYGKKTYLLLDECHRWSKAQSDSVLQAIEKGYIFLIGSTTENPYVNMTSAIVSRCRVFQFYPLSTSDIITVLKRAVEDKEKGLGNYNVEIKEDALKHLAITSNGDLRVALDSLELATITTPMDKENKKTILTLKIMEDVTQKRVISIDESDYYDFLSAFCKSLRGSDPDASVYYANRLINAGYDPRVVARRLVVHAAEDVGLADPYALVISISALTAVEKIGLPESIIPLTEAILYVALAPKSNSVIKTIENVNIAIDNIEKTTIPNYLLDPNYKGCNVKGYKYPHDFGGWVEQQYLPDELIGEKFYFSSQNGKEKVIIDIHEKNKKIKGE